MMKIDLNCTRRQFIKQFTLGSSVIMANPLKSICAERPINKRLFLLRYDTEWWGEWSEMDGFIEKVIEIHRSNKIPATFFVKVKLCTTLKTDLLNSFRKLKTILFLISRITVIPTLVWDIQKENPYRY